MGMTVHKRLVALMEEVRKISENGTEEEKQAYSNKILEMPNDVRNSYIATMMNVNTEKHYRNMLGWDLGSLSLELEYILENPFLNDEKKYELAVEFYEKILSYNEMSVNARATRMLEKNPMFKDYLLGKTTSDEFARESKRLWDEERKREEQEEREREITWEELDRKRIYEYNPTPKNYRKWQELREKSIDELREKKKKGR